MRMNFWTGILVGVAGVYVFHHWVSPMPGPNSAAKRQASGG